MIRFCKQAGYYRFKQLDDTPLSEKIWEEFVVDFTFCELVNPDLIEETSTSLDYPIPKDSLQKSLLNGYIRSLLQSIKEVHQNTVDMFEEKNV